MDQMTVKLCSKCGQQHAELTKWCKQCKEDKKIERKTQSPEAKIKDRESKERWKKNNPDKVRAYARLHRQRHPRESRAIVPAPELKQLIAYLEDSLQNTENAFETLTIEIIRADLNFIVELLKQVVSIT